MEKFEKAGFKAAGTNPKSGLVEIIELENHPYFVASQFHPEYKSTVMTPHPLFISFVKACVTTKA
jgi:CTP synthase